MESTQNSKQSLPQYRFNTERRLQYAKNKGNTAKIAIEEKKLVKIKLAIMQKEERSLSSKTQSIVSAIGQHDKSVEAETLKLYRYLAKNQDMHLNNHTKLISNNINMQDNYLVNQGEMIASTLTSQQVALKNQNKLIESQKSLIEGQQNLIEEDHKRQLSLLQSQGKTYEKNAERQSTSIKSHAQSVEANRKFQKQVMLSQEKSIDDHSKKFYALMGRLIQKATTGSDERIDEAIDFLLLASQNQIEEVVQSNFKFLSDENLFLGIATHIDLAMDADQPLEVCQLQRLAASLVNAFHKFGFPPFDNNNEPKIFDNDENADTDNDNLSGIAVDLFGSFKPQNEAQRENSSRKRKTIGSYDSADEEAASTILGLIREEALSTGASDQFEKEIIKEKKKQAEAQETLQQPPQAMSEEDALLKFVVTQEDCFKVVPKKFVSWLVEQDIVSMNDLINACKDPDFVNTDEMRTGGLKKFKKKSFIRAVTSY